MTQRERRVAIPVAGADVNTLARVEQFKAGSFRLITAWPFPEKQIAELSRKVKAFVVPELNLGQMVLEVELCAAGRARVELVSHAGGTVHEPADIYAAIRACVRR